jgi:trimethylamine--corrinoid protein Co-methyltransferase
LKKGDYLAHNHTVKNLRKTQWRPKLLSRIGTEKWIEQGKKSIVDRAKIKLDDILKNHKPKPIDNKKLFQINTLLENFK